MQVTCADAGELKKLVLKYDITNGNYLDFIAEVRSKARDGDKLSHGRPIPLEVDANPPYIGVNLQEGGVIKGVAMIRRYDLRLINFKDIFGNVIDVDHFQLYDHDSRLLDFGIEGFLLGLTTLVEAVDFLANSCKMLVMCNKKQLTNSQESSSVRTSLAVLCLVLCEATKVDFLSCLLGNAFKSGFKVPLTSWLLHRINDWEFFSEELVWDKHSDTAYCNYYLPDVTNDWHDGKRAIGVTCEDIAQFLGILRAVPLCDLILPDCLSGTSLVEVYTVRVFINGGRSGNVYGSIKIDNGYGIFHIYDRGRSKCEPVESHGTLSLQEPAGFITTTAKTNMVVNIMEEGGDNLEISKGKLSWGFGLGGYSYDSRLSAMVRGKNGYVIVNYSVFGNAIQAQLKVILLRKSQTDDTSDIRVHGGLTTRYCDFQYADHHKKYFQTTLFGKPFVSEELFVEPCTLETCKRGAEVKVGEALKLARSKVTVHVESSLEIVADLKCCNGKPVVTGSMEWVPKELGDFQEIMEGHSDDSHLLCVNVKWEKMVSVR